MATTTNFGWETPDDTDLVKDGAAAMRTLGNAIDASLVDLKGGTTGQVLSKASNTDLDYSWVTPELGDITAVTVSSPITGGGTTGSVNIAIQDGTTAQKGAVQLEDSTSSTSTTKAATPNSVKTAYDLANGAIAKSIVDAKADLITATADNTPARLAVGNDGETLVADSSASTGLRWQADYAAGKNKIINGDFGIWQRGTSFTLTNESYVADRFKTQTDKTGTISQQTFTAGTAPVSGYEGRFYLRSALNAVGSYYILNQMIEDVRTFAGQTITLSFWARVSSGTASNAPEIIQNFGSGGSASVTTTPSGQTITTDWQRFSVSVAIPSISGKTIGTNSSLEIRVLRFVSASAATIDIWGVQVEAGNVATAFQTATGTLAGEFLACCRYYQRLNAAGSGSAVFGSGFAGSTTVAQFVVPTITKLRTTSPDLTTSSVRIQDYGAAYTPSAIVLTGSNADNSVCLQATATGLTAYRPMFIDTNGSGYVGLSSEL